MTFYVAHKQWSVAGEADLGRESGRGSVIVPEITGEIENGGGIGKGRENEFANETETGAKEADIEDNPSGTSGHLKQNNKACIFLCVYK